MKKLENELEQILNAGKKSDSTNVGLKTTLRNKSLIGLKKKVSGDQFEAQIGFMASRQGLKCKKIPEGCKRLPGGRIIPIKSPFDFILQSETMTFFIDAKSTINDRFNYSQIDQSQVFSLEYLKNNHSLCGYIINLNETVYFFSVDVLKSCKPGTSLSREDGTYLGTKTSFNLYLLHEL